MPVQPDLVERLVAEIEQATQPRKMSKKAAIDVYESLIDELKMRIEALQEEMDNTND